MKLVIRDGTEPGAGNCLEFDLREVLAALGDRALTSHWRARDLDYLSKDERDVPIVEAMVRGLTVSGHDLASGIEPLLQVIDGEFMATDSNDERPWVIVRAVDSSWWEVVSNDAHVHEAIRNRFRVSDRSIRVGRGLTAPSAFAGAGFWGREDGNEQQPTVKPRRVPTKKNSHTEAECDNPLLTASEVSASAEVVKH